MPDINVARELIARAKKFPDDMEAWMVGYIIARGDEGLSHQKAMQVADRYVVELKLQNKTTR